MKLLTLSNTKTRKGEARGYVTFILHLAPGNLSGFNVCPGASKGCLASCLNTAGRGVRVQQPRPLRAPPGLHGHPDPRRLTGRGR